MALLSAKKMGMEIYRDTEKTHILVWDNSGRELLRG